MENYNCHCIVNIKEPAFSNFYEIFEKAFPLDERRALSDWKGAICDEASHIRLYSDKIGSPVAILCLWNLNCGRYVEYFAVREDLRGKGIGTSIFKSFIEESTKKVILEIEPLCNRTNILRWEFYKALGFSKNPGLHLHPPYRKGIQGNELLILNLGEQALLPDTREKFEAEIENDVMRYSLGE